MRVYYTYNDKFLSDKIKGIKGIENKLNELGNEAVSFYKKNFVNNTDWTPGHKDEGSTLVERSDLLKSIKVGEIKKSSFTVISDLPYSLIHNEGGEIKTTEKQLKFFKFKMSEAYSKHNDKEYQKWLAIYLTAKKDGKITISKRPFIFESKEVVKKIVDYIKKYF